MKQFEEIINGAKAVAFNGVTYRGAGVSYPVFDAKMQQVATNLGWQKEWLYAVMFVETAGTFSPSVKNPNSSATGLIQFMEATAKSLGTTTAKLSKMNAVEQLDYVERYFKPYKSKVISGYDVYLAVFRPAWLSDKTGVIKNSHPAYKPNRALDVDNDNVITYDNFISWVQKRNPTIVDLFEFGAVKKKSLIILVVASAIGVYFLTKKKSP